MKSRRYRRKMRKSRKSRKTKRGGSPMPPITFAAYDHQPTVLNPNFATPDNIREYFSLALIKNMNPDYQGDSPTVDLGLPVKITRIRGEENVEVVVDDIAEWDDTTITNFISDLRPGDHLQLTIA